MYKGSMSEQEEKWEEEFNEWWKLYNKEFFLYSTVGHDSYLQACRKRQEEIEKTRLELDFNREIRSSLESLVNDLEGRVEVLQKYLGESQNHCKKLEIRLNETLEAK